MGRVKPARRTHTAPKSGTLGAEDHNEEVWVRNAWQALRRGESVDARRRELERAHERFLEMAAPSVLTDVLGDAALLEHLPGALELRSVVFESWLRSRRNTIDPNSVPNLPALTDDELAELRRIHPLARVLPVVERLLFDEARESQLIVAVGDADGRLLWLDGDSKLRARAEDMGFREGMDWSESAMGTSAPGSALALKHPIQVLGAEHFNRAAHNWSCTAAPVHDPDTGEIVGVVDVTGGDAAASPHMLPLLQATLAAIEAELQLAALRDQIAGAAFKAPVHHETVAEVSLAAPKPRAKSNTPTLRVLGNEPAVLEWQDKRLTLSGRHAEILLALAEAKQGLSAGALAEQVHGQRSSEQTLRAEIVRLRRVLTQSSAPLELASRPYALRGELRVDATMTLQELGRGAHLRALASYSGPVLPESTSPVAERIRTELEATLREALLECARPDTLFEYAQRWAPDDAHVWETLLRVLPPQSPKRALVVARLDTLAA